MEYFLPIAQVEINLLFIFGLSLLVGVLSGLFGVGGGFLMTPFLIFLGIPPAYAVPNEASNILGTSVSGSTTHYLKGTLDYKMGFMIVIGGTIGTLLGILTFSYFQDIGKINIVISPKCFKRVIITLVNPRLCCNNCKNSWREKKEHS
mgnify:CR=1 FL=1